MIASNARQKKDAEWKNQCNSNEKYSKPEMISTMAQGVEIPLLKLLFNLESSALQNSCFEFACPSLSTMISSYFLLHWSILRFYMVFEECLLVL